ncbi:MAG: CBS domain-containing protein [Pseudomonadota bacterium]
MSQIKYIPVSDVMEPNIPKIDGLTSIAEAIGKMKDANSGSLIVDKRDDRDEYGLISIGDLAANVISPDFAPERMSAYQVMNKPVISVESDMNIRYAIRLLTNFKISVALVVKQGKAVGLVRLRDMVFAYTE